MLKMIGIASVVLAGGCAGSLADLPGPAAAALQRHAGGAELGGVEKETDHGVALYEGAWKTGDVHHEAKVTADGDLVELEETVAPSEVPAKVRDAAARTFGGGALRYTRKTLIRYEVEARVDGKEREVLYTPTGRVTPDDDDDGDDGDGDGDGDDDDDGDAAGR